MKFDKTFKPELFASPDETRPHFANVHFDADAKALVATDGHRIIVIPVTECADDHSGPISPEVLKEARRIAPKGKHAEASVSANGVLKLDTGASYPRPDVEAFPPYRRVMESAPRHDSHGNRTVTINARYLASIFSAIGDTGVTITIGGAFDPIRFSAESDGGPIEGLIMPMRR